MSLKRDTPSGLASEPAAHLWAASTVPGQSECEPANRMSWQPGARIDRYELIEPIGAGGMGVVWSARDVDLGREVAIKFISGASGGGPPPNHRVRLLGEARALARLSHPNVVTIHDVGSTQDCLFIVMERLDGGTLADWLHEGARTCHEVVARFAAAGRGLAEAHRAGLVHRDFKPDNVLMGRDGIARVCDFGLAFPVGETGGAPEPMVAHGDYALTQDGALVGTLPYMAPEQLLGEKVTARSDQFSFCVALHEALYGVKPFRVPADGAAAAFFLSAIVEKRFAPLADGRKVPARLHGLTLRGLACRPDDRWPSMDALVEELERWSRKRRRQFWVVAPALAGGGLLAAVLAVLPGSPGPGEAPPHPAFDPLNLGFEAVAPDRPKKPFGWHVGGDGYEVVLDPAGAHSGAHGLRLRFQSPAGAGAFGVATNSAPANAFRGKFVRLTGWLRTREVAGGWAGLWMRVDGSARPTLSFDNMSSRGITGATDWTRYSIDLPVPIEATSIYFGALLSGTGTAWVDDFTLSPLWELPTPNRLAVVPRRTADDLSLSPDGKQVAFSMPGDVQVVTLASEEVRTIALPDATRDTKVLGWYPDGERLLVLREPEDTSGARAWDEPDQLWSLPVAAGGPAPALVKKEASCGAISPVGGELAFCLRRQVFVSDEKGTTRAVYSSDAEPGLVKWAPDGKHVAVLGYDRKRGWTLVSVRPDGRELHFILRDEPRLSQFGPTGLAWISGRRIVYSVAQGRTGSVLYGVAIDARTGMPGPPTGLAMVEGPVFDLSGSADGRKLAFYRSETQNSVHIARLVTGSARAARVTHSERDEWLAGWAADGKAFYFTVGAGPTRTLYRQEVGGSDVARVRAVSRRFTLAPDRSHLLELTTVSGANDGPDARLALFASPLGRGVLERLGSFELPASEAPVCQCAATCVVARTVDGEGVFHRLDLETGPGPELARIDADTWAKNDGMWSLSNDGDRVAIPAGNELHIVDLTTRKREVVHPRHHCLYQFVAWAPDGGTLYATCIGSPWSGQLVRIRSGGASEVLLTDRSAWLSDPELAPDGRQIAFNAMTFSGDAWMFEGL